jgi:hypothetical protein
VSHGTLVLPALKIRYTFKNESYIIGAVPGRCSTKLNRDIAKRRSEGSKIK